VSSETLWGELGGGTAWILGGGGRTLGRGFFGGRALERGADRSESVAVVFDDESYRRSGLDDEILDSVSPLGNLERREEKRVEKVGRGREHDREKLVAKEERGNERTDNKKKSVFVFRDSASRP